VKADAPDLTPDRGVLLQPSAQAVLRGGDLFPRPGVQIAPKAAKDLDAQVFSPLHGRRGQQEGLQLGFSRRLYRIDSVPDGLGRAAELG